jgi:hypothetical protein
VDEKQNLTIKSFFLAVIVDKRNIIKIRFKINRSNVFHKLLLTSRLLLSIALVNKQPSHLQLVINPKKNNNTQDYNKQYYNKQLLSLLVKALLLYKECYNHPGTFKSFEMICPSRLKIKL